MNYYILSNDYTGVTSPKTKLDEFYSAIVSKSLTSLDELREIFLNNCPDNVPIGLATRMR
jgi:hypothetical protein